MSSLFFPYIKTLFSFTKRTKPNKTDYHELHPAPPGLFGVVAVSLVARQNLHMRGRPGRKKRAWGATAAKHRKRKAMRETGKYPGKNAIAMRPQVGLGLGLMARDETSLLEVVL